MVNRTAVVTGASQGIGRSTAIRLAKDFSSLALVARRKENLQEIADEVKKTGGGLFSFRLAKTGGQP
jgi:short-subunit dehydrogenase